MTEPFGRRESEGENRDQPTAGTMTHGQHPWRLKEMTPSEVRDLVVGRPWLIVPVGTTEQHGPHLPLTTDTVVGEC